MYCPTHVISLPWPESAILPVPTDLDNGTNSFSYPGANFLGDQGFVTYYEKCDRRISLVLRRFTLRIT